jgi:serine/threonine protein kinase
MSTDETGLRSCHSCGVKVPTDNRFCGVCGARWSTEITADDELIGQVIDDRFRIETCLATGGMGAVYRAEHVGIGKQVALKFLRADLRNQPILAQRLRREAMAVSKLTDVHTISVFDFGVWKGLPYLVMEYLQGEDLATLLSREKRLPEFRALNIFSQICASLAEAHGVGVVHRDLKPENIFLTYSATGEEIVKVLDFGLAKLLDADGGDNRFQTQDGAILGTPYYMAPEQTDGREIDEKADLYALGAVFFRTLTGFLPYSGKSPVEVFTKQRSGKLPVFGDIAPDANISFETESLVQSLMAMEPQDRPESALTIGQTIVELLRNCDDAYSSQIGRRALELGERPPAKNSGLGETLTDSAPQHMLVGAMLNHSEDAHPDPEWTDPIPKSAAADQWSIESQTEFKRSDSLSLDNGFFETEFDSDVGVSNLVSPEEDRFADRLRQRRVIRGILALTLITVGTSLGVWYYRTAPSKALSQEREPNDRSVEANRIKSGQSISGHIGYRAVRAKSDQDMYFVQTPDEPVKVEVRLTPVPGLDLVAEIISYEGKILATMNRGRVGRAEFGSVEVKDARGVQIRVREHWIADEVPKENSTDPYELTVTIIPQDPSKTGSKKPVKSPP